MLNSPVHASDLDTGPTFDQPPVVETALGIQFANLDGFSSIHFGEYFELIKSRYDKYEDHGRLPRITETFPKVTVPQTLQISSVATMLPRVFFYERGCQEKLIQLQPDRFGFNWSAAEEGKEEYPRYSENVPQLLKEFACFATFCADRNIGQVVPDTCEVVYVNQIFPKPGENVIDLFAQVFSGVEWRNSDAFLRAPEAAALNRTYEIGERDGRLYAEAAIAKHSTKGDFVSLKMIARTFVRSPEGVEDSLHLAHKWVVQGFVSLTDPGIRGERWKQQLGR